MQKSMGYIGSFFLGFIFGIVALSTAVALLGFYVYGQIKSGDMRLDQGFLNGTDLRTYVERQLGTRTAFAGEVVTLETDVVTISAEVTGGTSEMRFRYDNQTVFLWNTRLDVGPEYISSEDFSTGDAVIVYIDPDTARDPEPYAEKITK